MNNTLTSTRSIPEAFFSKMSTLLGDEFDEFRTSLYQPPRIGLRVNTLKIPSNSFAQISPYKLSPSSWCSSGFTMEDINASPESLSPGKHPFHLAGLYYLQEPSAMVVGELLSPQPGEIVLDLAAAPGGKATHLAALMKNTGLLIANEIHPRRVWDLAENMERCGVTNAIITNETPQRLAERFFEFFDRILLDAPCSGEGMFRKSSVACEEWNSGVPLSCAIRQFGILENASRMVKPGGCLAYATCTFSPEENEGVISRFLDNHPEFDLKRIECKPGFSPAKPEWINLPSEHKINRSVRIWPHLSQGEGHYIALLLKNGSAENLREKDWMIEKSHHKNRNAKELVIIKKILDAFIQQNLDIVFEERRISIKGSYVYYLPEQLPGMHGLKVIHPGWWIGSFHNNRFYPSHALALGINILQAKNICSLQMGNRDISAYLGGLSFPNPGDDGWVLITVDDFPIGWGKRVQNVIKNYYPHGLRQQS